jgi:hypothetical protein
MRYLLLLFVVALCIAGCGEITWLPNNYGNIPTQNDVTFTPQTNVKVLTQVQSNTLTVTGLTNPVGISVVNGEYSIEGVNNGAFTSAAGTVSNNQKVIVRHTSSMALGGKVDTKLTIGSKSGTFTSTTTGTDPTFTFPAKSDAPGTTVTSDPLTISGAALAINLSIVNGEYSIGSDPFTSATSNTLTDPNGKTLRVRNTAAATAGLKETTTLTILNGTVTLKGTFETTAL